MSLSSGALHPWPTAPPGSGSLGATSRNERVTIHPSNDSTLGCLGLPYLIEYQRIQRLLDAR